MSGLKDGTVISVPHWKIPVISHRHYLQQPALELDVRLPVHDIRALSVAEFKVFATSFEAAFTPAFERMSDAWFADMQKLMDGAEHHIDELAAAAGGRLQAEGLKLLQPAVDKANHALEERCQAWKVMVDKLARSCFDEAWAAAAAAAGTRPELLRVRPTVQLAPQLAFLFTGPALALVRQNHPMRNVSEEAAKAIRSSLHDLQTQLLRLEHDAHALGDTARDAGAAGEKLQAALSAFERMQAKGHASAGKGSGSAAALHDAVARPVDDWQRCREQVFREVQRLVGQAGQLETAWAGVHGQVPPRGNAASEWRTIEGLLGKLHAEVEAGLRLLKDVDDLARHAKALEASVKAGDVAAARKAVQAGDAWFDALHREMLQAPGWSASMQRVLDLAIATLKS